MSHKKGKGGGSAREARREGTFLHATPAFRGRVSMAELPSWLLEGEEGEKEHNSETSSHRHSEGQHPLETSTVCVCARGRTPATLLFANTLPCGGGLRVRWGCQKDPQAAQRRQLQCLTAALDLHRWDEMRIRHCLQAHGISTVCMVCVRSAFHTLSII